MRSINLKYDELDLFECRNIEINYFLQGTRACIEALFIQNWLNGVCTLQMEASKHSTYAGSVARIILHQG